jgi:hypothetical protein
MAKLCLKYLPNESSAIIVSHCSPKNLIANLITNKPVHSPSLKHSILLNHTHNIGLATPTLIRKGLPINVIRGMDNLDWNKLKDLLEKLFKKTKECPSRPGYPFAPGYLAVFLPKPNTRHRIRHRLAGTADTFGRYPRVPPTFYCTKQA